MEFPSRHASSSARGVSLPLMLAIGLVCVTGVSAARELYRREQVRQDLTTLEDRVAKLETRKTEVSDLLKRLDAPDVIDREARLRLQMQRPGERVYVLRGESWEMVQQQESGLPNLYKDSVNEPTRSNPERWFRRFFVHAES